MDTQMTNSGQPFVLNTQPIGSIVTNAESAYTGGNKAQNQEKVRFTRAQRRQYAKEKRAAQVFSKDPKKPARTKSHAPFKGCNDIDEVIAYLINMRDRSGNSKISSGITKSLASRMTFPKPKKVPSPEKLEKLQKRKELRAQKRKVRMAEKAAKKDTEGQPGDGAAIAQQQDTPDFDEISFE